VQLLSPKTRGVDVPNAVMDFFYEHVPGTNDLDTAYFTAVQVNHSTAILTQSIVAIAETFPQGVGKGMLRELVYDDLGGAFSHQKIRAELDHMVEVTGDLTIAEGRQGAKLVTVRGL